jgi:hypothetical protein
MKWDLTRMSRGKASRKLDDFFLLTALGIARESATLFLQHSSSLVCIAVLLLSPASAAIILSHGFLDRLLVVKLAIGIQAAFGYGTAGLIIRSHHNHYALQLFYHKLSETILSYVFCFPFLATFSLWAKAAVAHTVASNYAGNRPSWQRLIEELPKLWKRLVGTYIWVCLLVLGFNVLMFVFMSTVINGVSVLGLPAIWEIGAAMCGGILYSIVFAHVMIVCNLATVVCVMEADCCYGLDAVFRAMFLIRGRTHIALLMALLTNMSLALVESLFQYRVMGMRHGSNFSYEKGSRINSSAVWEAPLLVFIYSMVGVMEGVMSCVFYYTCKSSRLEGIFLNYSPFQKPLADEYSSKQNLFSVHCLENKIQV